MNEDLEVSERRKRHIEEVNRMFSGKVIYSWTNEKGQKSFSNIGFPEDGKYKDGKIEWH